LQVVFDIEADGLKPKHIWCIVCKDIKTGEYHIFRNLKEDDKELNRFHSFHAGVDLWIGHHILGYDIPVIKELLGIDTPVDKTLDTLILSKMMDYSRKGGHSIEQYGEEFGIPKDKFNDWSKYSPELEARCVRDTDLSELIYKRFKRIVSDESWNEAIRMEHSFQIIVNELSARGFGFNTAKATRLLDKITAELNEVDRRMAEAFPPRLRLIREVTPKATKYGTISLSSIPLKIRQEEGSDLSAYSVDAPFSFCHWVAFNPSSHKQLIEVLNEAGWKPTDKTQTHIDAERELRSLQYKRNRSAELDTRVKELHTNLQKLRVSGYKINEENLATLPNSAPPPARMLAKRILLESRRRTLTEWLSLVSPEGRIHGDFYGIGAWTHRMAHQKPNTANIPTEAKLFGGEMRSLWQAPRKRLLVGVDAEGIQLRIFAHYINDPEFTDALVRGRKDDKTDPHSLNQRILGAVCKSRQDAKRFIYALLLGAGNSKLAEILGCSASAAEEALARLLERYTGWKTLKDVDIPRDGKRGWFYGLDGRKVKIPGEAEGSRKHLATSGYLQNGEAIVIKRSALKFSPDLPEDFWLVDIVHDEYVIEGPNDLFRCEEVRDMVANSIKLVGEELGLRCPLAGDGSVGLNWYEIH
jgi:DNA polymerase-1